MAQFDDAPEKDKEPILPKEFAHLEKDLRNQRKNLENLDKQEDRLPPDRQRPEPALRPPGTPVDNQPTRGEKQNYINLQRSAIRIGFNDKIDASPASPEARNQAKEKAQRYFDGREKNMERSALEMMKQRLAPRYANQRQPEPEQQPEKTATQEQPLHTMQGKASAHFMATPNYDQSISQDGPGDVQAPEPDISPDKD